MADGRQVASSDRQQGLTNVAQKVIARSLEVVVVKQTPLAVGLSLARHFLLVVKMGLIQIASLLVHVGVEAGMGYPQILIH
jgi:hypothetical protein